MKWRWICVGVFYLLAGLCGFAQHTTAELFSGSGVISARGSGMQDGYFTALGGNYNSSGVWAAASRFSGVPMGTYALHAWLPRSSQGLGIRVKQSGFSAFTHSSALLYYGRKLSGQLDIAAGIGIVMYAAAGYSRQWAPAEGIGLGFQITQRCRWLLQAEGLHRFFLPESPGAYSLKTGLGYRCGEAVSLTLEYYIDEQAGQGIGLVCHYQPVRQALFRVGMVNRQFLVSGGWRFGQCWIELGLGWQAALGLQQQLQVSIDWEKKAR
jgi:hypothetical protein